MKAHKIGETSYSLIYADLELNKGIFTWELFINTKNINRQWITSGLIEKSSLEKAISESTPYNLLCGVSTYGQRYNASNETSNSSAFDNINMKFVLDTLNSTFIMSSEGIEYLKVIDNQFKEKTWIPAAILYTSGNEVALKSFDAKFLS